MPITTLLALHYFAGAGAEFEALRPYLPAGFRLLAPDLPGFGQQPAPAGFDYSVASYADWVMAFIEENKLDDFILLGHSMGGKIALALAGRRLPGLRRLVLLAPSPPPGEPMTEAARAFAYEAFGQAKAAKDTFHKITHRHLTPDERDQIIAANLATTRPAWDAWLAHGSQEDITALLPHLPVPCQLLVGAKDHAIAPIMQYRHTLPHLPPGTRLELLPGTGHLLPLEAPETVAAAVAVAAGFV